MLPIDLLPSSESFLEARVGKMIQSDEGAVSPDEKDVKRSTTSTPENGMWLQDSFSKPESS